ncbi:MAG: hypothetical protein HY319_17410 [Armatimonadetes bacterium]|nr:hypothetical protein [Armatimonadota bacterium]
MKRFLRLGVAAVALVGALVLNATGAQAEVTWDAVVKKLKSAKDYTVKYEYEGPKGKFEFDHRIVDPNGSPKVRTEILNSKSEPGKKGTVLVYDPAWNKDKVRAKIGGGAITRNLTHKDVVDTPFYQGIFTIVMDQVAKCGKAAISKDGDKTVFRFKCGGGTYTVWANANAEIVRTERIADKVKEVRQFSSITWNSGPNVSF